MTRCRLWSNSLPTESLPIKQLAASNAHHSLPNLRRNKTSDLLLIRQMFGNGVEVISHKLEHISLDIQKNMQPKANERPPVCPNGKVPVLHLTPTNSGQKKNDKSPEGVESPWLLKPKHDIPATPPPQSEPQAFFPQRAG